MQLNLKVSQFLYLMQEGAHPPPAPTPTAALSTITPPPQILNSLELCFQKREGQTPLIYNLVLLQYRFSKLY